MASQGLHEEWTTVTGPVKAAKRVKILADGRDGALTMRNVTVLDVLNEIVRHGDAAFWEYRQYERGGRQMVAMAIY